MPNTSRWHNTCTSRTARSLAPRISGLFRETSFVCDGNCAIGGTMRLRAVRQVVALAMLAALPFPDPAAAQLTRGGISGIVRDQQGAVVPGATVTVKNLATGAVRSAVTDVNGLYRVPALDAGVYLV